MKKKIIFNIVELTAFILPALPNSLILRLLILLIYFVGHYFKLQKIYLQIKNKCVYDL